MSSWLKAKTNTHTIMQYRILPDKGEERGSKVRSVVEVLSFPMIVSDWKCIFFLWENNLQKGMVLEKMTVRLIISRDKKNCFILEQEMFKNQKKWMW